MPTYAICIELILYRIKLKPQAFKRKAAKQPWPKRILQWPRFDEDKNKAHMIEMAKEAELANYRW